METVGIRELKSRLSLYIRRVEAGEMLVVTDRGRVVAEIRPPGFETRPDIHPGLLEMERRGLVRLAARRNDPSLYPRMPSVDLGDETVQDILDDLRGNR